MRMVLVGGERRPLGTGLYADLMRFLADPVEDEKGCHPFRANPMATLSVPDGQGKRRPSQLAYETLTGDDATTGTVLKCRTNPQCLRLDHLGFRPHPGWAPKAQPTDTACGAGHPWTVDTIYEFTAVRQGVKVVERQCRTCRATRKREARQRESRWRLMGWTP